MIGGPFDGKVLHIAAGIYGFVKIPIPTHLTVNFLRVNDDPHEYSRIKVATYKATRNPYKWEYVNET